MPHWFDGRLSYRASTCTLGNHSRRGLFNTGKFLQEQRTFRRKDKSSLQQLGMSGNMLTLFNRLKCMKDLLLTNNVTSLRYIVVPRHYTEDLCLEK